MIPDQDARAVALEIGLVPEDKLEELSGRAKRERTLLLDQLLSVPSFQENAFYRGLADRYKLPFVAIDAKSLPQEAVQRLPEPLAIKHLMVVYELDPGEIGLATCQPPDPVVVEMIERELRVPAHVAFTTPRDLNAVLNLYRADVEEELEKIDPTLQHVDVVDLIHSLIENAIRMNASDIHIEPRQKRSVIRYRVDGQLREVASLPLSIHSAVVSRVKILSNIKLEEHRQPQDGRFSLSGPGYRVSIRASTTPLLDHEKAVLRILRQDKRFEDLTELGLRDDVRKIVEQVLTRNYGMILVTGPTGSGKTTTLYTLLTRLDRPDINISTIEDPIEYNFEQINQSQVNPAVNYSFHIGLRGMLRQDPDVIMVGEIRDMETATTALRAALTGHLVLSTLHTNDAATTLTRLQEMGIPNYLTASTVNLVIAQRLVRNLCAGCRRRVPLSVKLRRDLERTFGEDFKNAVASLGKRRERLCVYEPGSCPKCEEGYRGRTGIFEVLPNTPRIHAAILEGKSAKAIERIARNQGMRSLAEDGIVKTLKGVTSLKELLRVI